MSLSRVEAVASAVLYEGYALYPYRASSVKSRRRFNFGVVVPQAAVARDDRGYPWRLQAECVVEGDARALVSVAVRFLKVTPTPGGAAPSPFDDPYLDAVERNVTLPDLAVGAEPGVHRTRFQVDGLEGDIAWHAEPLPAGGFRVSVSVANTTAIETAQPLSHNAVLPYAFVSTHLILRVAGGAFISLLEPPDEWRAAVAGCSNTGVWPVLAGEPGCRDVMLASPIILYDYPEVAAESPGDLFDGAEIDEILTLRILTLTDGEKAEMRADERTRRLLERTESLTPDHLRRLHGVMRAAHDPRQR